MTAVYDNSGIRFLYPENWKIDTEADPDWPESVSLQSPSGAFWSITVHPPDAAPDELNETVLQTMQEEYKDLEAEPVTEEIADTTATGYDMSFCCLDLLVAARLRTFFAAGRTFVLLCQAEDREFDQLEYVFRAITESLLNPTK